MAFAAQSSNQKASAMEITSPAFGSNEAIPTLYTCEGRNVSAPLAWSGVPQNAKSLARTAGIRKYRFHLRCRSAARGR
jgi:phosphatidylethanolamine-binding protein (PEBP) family uncharacterized protein